MWQVRDGSAFHNWFIIIIAFNMKLAFYGLMDLQNVLLLSG